MPDQPRPGATPPGAGDNATAHAALDYEAEVKRTIPLHGEILATALEVALAVRPSPRAWLDTGCGPGELVALARARAPATRYWLADPSAAMLALARARHPDLPAERFAQRRSEELDPGFAEPCDVITAILCHHYGDRAAREQAVARCGDFLVRGGVLIVFENVRSETEAGHAVQRARQSAWQRRAGLGDEAVARHLAREGTAMFPIRVSEHLALFARAGLEAELVWRAWGQAGFACRKR